MTQAQVNLIATEYRDAEHVPDSPSYRTFIAETIAQYRALVASGLRISLGDSPATSDQPFSSIASGSLLVSPEGSSFSLGNPMATWIPDLGVTVNTAFRAVHDVLGHFAIRTPFETFQGELGAYLSHKRQYSLEAIPALYSETIGQLCHFYSGVGFVSVQSCKIIEVRI